MNSFLYQGRLKGDSSVQFVALEENQKKVLINIKTVIGKKKREKRKWRYMG